MKSRMIVGATALALLVGVATWTRIGQSQSPEAAAPAANERSLTLVNIKYEGTNIWINGPLVVKKGDKVKLRLINNVKDDPAEHGLAIDEVTPPVKAVVKRGEPQTVEFTADKAGVFKTSCHLHLPHVGTQLVVLE
jgi:nitrosocyanin